MSRAVYDAAGRVVAYEEAGVGLDAPWRRPPLGPPLLGRRSSAGGRGNRASANGGAHADRARLAAYAVELRLAGATYRQIADAVGRSVSVVHRWLGRMPRVGGVGGIGAEVGRHAADIGTYLEEVDKRGEAS
ncbi:helix-turn-helix domain-containing protein [Dactylosporangium vinaceum]|nr:helix-turn-helix domain-containing protein [Dactylosporangium vinaceum]